VARAEEVLEALTRDKREAVRLVQAQGLAETQRLLEDAAADLKARLARAVTGPGSRPFTVAQLRATLAQVQLVTRDLARGLDRVTRDGGERAARTGAKSVARELMELDRVFRGVGGRPLALDAARMLTAAQQGVRASLLRRVALSGTERAKGTEAADAHRGRPGVLRRYGSETIARFEHRLRVGLVAGKSWGDVEDDLLEESPFLRGAPRFWATRIVRTEAMGALNRAAWESARVAHAQLGDVVKILSATFDDRTGADSYAVHGQVRRVEEPFEWWEGAYMHPPNRPNDREVVVTFREIWPVPKILQPVGDEEVAAAWKREGRKGAPPPRPRMSFSSSKVTIGIEPKPKVRKERLAADHLSLGSHVLESEATAEHKGVPRRVVEGLSRSLPDKQRAQVARALKKVPLQKLVVVSKLSDVPGSNAAVWWNRFGPDNDEMHIVLSGQASFSGMPFQISDAGRLEFSIGHASRTAAESLQRVFSHEMGHHLHLGVGKWNKQVRDLVHESFGSRKSTITRYAGTSEEEYFAESFAAYVHERAALRKQDPEGYEMVERVLDLLDG
jgi:hypothetical protein